MQNEEDLPKSIVVVLVILAVAISVLGTFTVLSEMNKLKTAPEYTGQRVTSGEIKLRVEDPNGPTSATGQIILKVENKPEVMKNG